MKKWTDLTSLGLLDDSAELEIPTRAFETLIRTPAPRATTTAGPNPASLAATAPAAAESKSPVPARTERPAAPRVFSSRPTLRQLMHEYNRRTAHTTPIKCHSPSEGRDVFRFQSVDLIQLPSIPGKILRPARSS